MDILAISGLSRGQFMIESRPVEVALCRRVAMHRKVWLPTTLEQAKDIQNGKAPPGALELF